MNLENLEGVLEGILFVSGAPVAVDEICQKTSLQKGDVERAAEKLGKKYSASSGIHIISFNGKLQLCSNPSYADAIASVLNPIREKELSRSSLEVAAIVAYKQPITRLEIEEVRGVNSDYALQMLIKHNLVEAVGRKEAVGKPMLFGTTDEFLKHFQLSDLKSMPDYDTIMERIKVVGGDGKKADDELYSRADFTEEEVTPPDLEGMPLVTAEDAG